MVIFHSYVSLPEGSQWEGLSHIYNGKKMSPVMVAFLASLMGFINQHNSGGLTFSPSPLVCFTLLLYKLYIYNYIILYDNT